MLQTHFPEVLGTINLFRSRIKVSQSRVLGGFTQLWDSASAVLLPVHSSLALYALEP